MASEKALQLAAQAWCTEATRNRVMDPVLAEAFADILDREWKDSIDKAFEHYKSQERYYTTN